MPPFGGDTNNYISPRNGRGSGKLELRLFFVLLTMQWTIQINEWID